MEFYKIMMRAFDTLQRFQFPTGWNSTKKCKRFATMPAFCFNSQRDGILRKVIYTIRAEFEGFNSQRDGILRGHRYANQMQKGVSIPNGMEFYRNDKAFSQSHREVSIPNGMEFYLTFLGLFSKSLMFQFPTGWNSTITDWYFLAFQNCFNSQRDGILLYLHRKALHYVWLVSIPNGMEFYRTNFMSAFIASMFQFPTGWNSTGNSGAPFIDSEGFNSQRDGILLDRRRKLVDEKLSFNSQRDGILQYKTIEKYY